MAAQRDNGQSQQRIKELEDEIQNYRVYYRYLALFILLEKTHDFHNLALTFLFNLPQACTDHCPKNRH